MSRFALLALVLAVPAAADPAWLHLSIHERGRRGAHVRVNVPVAAVVRGVRLVPEHRSRGCRIDLGKRGLTAYDLDAIWYELRNRPEQTIVTRDTGELELTAVRIGQSVELRVNDEREGTSLRTRVPARVLEALVSGGAGRLDLVAAVGALALAGEGEIALVADDGARVRIWIDGVPGQMEE
ncbi:MAG TPA: hypothetical protein VMS56_06795 [Thermoanaerobaculia bacterium]|nr:hypothetical protein [Thermoanaerobaculia bacterium]